MFAIVYLAICISTGYMICNLTLPGLQGITANTFKKEKLNLARQFVVWPAYFITGTVLVTWTAYLLALCFQKTTKPLVYADAITMGVFLLFSVVGGYFLYQRKKQKQLSAITPVKYCKLDWIFLALVGALSIQLMWWTFHITKGQLKVGISVFSDFSPHIGMIRSFSHGNNFPTSYSHFAGEDIRYHFMYQFLVGNLEFLGMRLDWAMNLPSILGMISSFCLLFVLAVKMTGKRAVGYLSCLFFAFRSSESLFRFLAAVPKGQSIIKALKENGEFLSCTTNEDWGLWNLNVYCNQRHLIFTIPLLLLMVLIFLPSVYESLQGLDEEIVKIEKDQKNKHKHIHVNKLWIAFRYCFLRKESWKIQDIRRTIVCGLFIGALAFWNGAVTITILLVLFVFAIAADRKLEYLIVAVMSVLLSCLQSSTFIHGSAIGAKFDFGFIAENKTLFGTIDYILRLTGILPVVLLVALIWVKKEKRFIMAAFFMPFLFAFTISLTPDVTVNHKYIMMSVMLLCVYAAIVVEKLFSSRSVLLKVVSAAMAVMLTATGMYDYRTVIKKNHSALVLDMNSSLTKWIMDNTDAKDIILSSEYALNQVVLGGGMLFYGWPYFAWSAGYDTDTRCRLQKEMFEAASPEQLKQLIEENHIAYIIIDNDCRLNQNYIVNESNIDSTYQRVYEDGEGDTKTIIYDTSQPKIGTVQQ